MFKKEIFVIGSYPSDDIREELLIKQIDILKRHSDVPILVVTHFPISLEIQKSVDYFIYDSDNNLGDDISFNFSYYFDSPDISIRSKLPANNYHAPSILTSMKNALKFCLGRYDIIHYVESDFFFYVNNYLDKCREQLDKGKKFFGLRDDFDDDINGGLMSFDVEWMNSKIDKGVYTWDDYKKLDYFMRKGDDDPGQLIFEPWFYRYFEKFNMLKDATLWADRRDFIIVENACQIGPSDRLFLSETDDGNLIMFITRSVEDRSNSEKLYKIVNNLTGELIVSGDIDQAYIVWHIVPKKDMILDFYINDCIVDNVVIDKNHIYSDTFFRFSDDHVKCAFSEEEFEKDWKVKKIDKLMIVAHPDDESIFGGNALLTEKGWKVISVTGGNDKIRKREFEKAMNKAGVDAFEIWGFKDSLNDSLDTLEVTKKINKVVNERKYEKVVTHNSKGEYGHVQHISLHNVVNKLIKGDMWVFGYSENRLSDINIENKIEMLKMYESQAATVDPKIPCLPSYEKYIFNEEITVKKKSLKLNLGCGNDIKDGYINIDKYNNLQGVDICCDISELPYKEDTVDEILLYHILEHFPFRKVPVVLKEWRRVLKTGGIIKIRVPNLDQWIEKWNSFSDDDKFNRLGLIFGDENHEGNFHHSGFTEGSLKYLLRDNGFDIVDSSVRNAFGGNVLQEIDIIAKKVFMKEDKVENILVSFVDGAKVEMLGEGNSVYEIDFIDQDNGSSVHSDFLKLNHWTLTNRKYYTNWLIKVSCMGKTIFEYKFDLTDKRVLISFESKSLGDTIAWFPYVDEFRKKYNCQIILSTFWNHLFEKKYLEIEYVTPGQVVDNLFAHYEIGCWDNDSHRNKYDWRITSIQKMASDVLGSENKEIIPKITIPESKKSIDGKYVCIGIHSTAQCKYWNYPGGWQRVTDYLVSKGYKVVFISKESGEYMGNLPPTGIIDKSGDLPIEDRIVDLRYADMFIGVSSGLTWLSWAVGTPSIMISGCTLPMNEFSTNVERLFNKNVCNGCFNDDNIIFNRGDWRWCPRNKDFECSKSITPGMVIEAIERTIKKGQNE